MLAFPDPDRTPIRPCGVTRVSSRSSLRQTRQGAAVEWIAGAIVGLVVLIVGVAMLLTARHRRDRALENGRDLAPPAEADARAAASYISRNADIGGSSGGS